MTDRGEPAAEYLRSAADRLRDQAGRSSTSQWRGKEYGVYAVHDSGITDLTISARVGTVLAELLYRQAHQADQWDMHPPHDDVFALAAAVLGRDRGLLHLAQESLFGGAA